MQFLHLSLLAAAAAVASARVIDVDLTIQNYNDFTAPATMVAEDCLRVCFADKPKCPGSTYPKQFDDCWACCFQQSAAMPATTKNIESGNTPSNKVNAEELEFDIGLQKHHEFTTATTQNPAMMVPDICWRVCFPKEQKCPENSHSKQFGDCWTCCFESAVPVITKNIESGKIPSNKVNAEALEFDIGLQKHHEFTTTAATTKNPAMIVRDICWRACFPEKVQCPETGRAKQFGDCWTCCFGQDESAVPVTTKKIESGNTPSNKANAEALEFDIELQKHHEFTTTTVTTKNPAMIVTDICWRACFPEKPQCPETAHAKQFGDCWTCCFGEDESAVPVTTKNIESGKTPVNAEALEFDIHLPVEL
jgi:hypothetical protein